MFYLQIAAAIVSLLIGIVQVTKESVPLVQQVTQQRAQIKAMEIASMNINWQYRGSDNDWRYYSDVNNVYWCRINAQGIVQYSERPKVAVSNNNNVLH